MQIQNKEAMIKTTKEDIDKFLDDNFKTLVNPEYMYGVDNNQDKAEDFYTADLRILVTFLSTGADRSVSSTYAALDHLLHDTYRVVDGVATNVEKDFKVFVDSSYYPEQDNIKLFNDNNIPFMFGNVSHEPYTEYDIVLISQSVLSELYNYPHLLYNSGIPITLDQRIKDTSIPLLFAGGAALSETSILLGPIYNGDEYLGKSLYDVAQYGYGENVLPLLVEELIKFKKLGKDFKKDKAELKEFLKENEPLHDYLFHPEAYEWVYDEDNFTIKEIKKLDDRLPDRVKYNRIYDCDFKGFPKKIFNLTGESAKSHDIMISSGCTGGSSACSFCLEGTVAGVYRERPIESLIEDMEYIKRTSAPSQLAFYSYNLNYYDKFGDLLFETAKRFSTMSLRNERMDILAHAKDQLDLAKFVGLKRMSSAVEGISDRVRNKILNKNLPREVLMEAMKNIFDLRLMHVKLGMILTGQETPEDVADFESELKEIIEIRDEVGANSSLQSNFCTVKETLSPVKGRGLLRQDTLMKGTEIDANGYSVIKDAGFNKKSEVIKIELESGQELIGTPNHPVIKFGLDATNHQNFMYLSDVKVGDEIQCVYNTQAFGEDLKFILENDERLIFNKYIGRALGLFLSKGSFEQAIEENLITKDQERQLLEFITFYDFKQDLEDRNVLDIILQSSKATQLAFLDGLLNIDINGKDLKMESKSKVLVKDVQVMLMNLGFISKITNLEDGLYELRISKSYKEVLNIEDNIVGLKVVSIEKLEPVDTYFVTTESGLYTTNGILSHNTPLVFYSQTAIRYLPRITSRHSFNKEKTATDILNVCKKYGVRAKVNGSGYGTYFEQLGLDFGPAGTNWLVNVCLNHGMYASRSFNETIKEASVKVLKENGYDDPLFFTDERPNDWIFPNDHIIYVSDEIIEMWKERHSKMDFSTPMCLNTLANESPKCINCNLCEPQDKIKMLKRDFSNEHTVEEVKEYLSGNVPVDSTRIVVKKDPKWTFYNNQSIKHIIISRFLSKNDKLADNYYAAGKSSLDWVTNNAQIDRFGGTFAFDVDWKSNIDKSELDPYIEEINNSLTAFKIVKVIPHQLDLPIKINQENLWMGEITGMTLSQLNNKLVTFDNEIKVAIKGMGDIAFKTVNAPEVIEGLSVVSSKGRLLYTMSTPMNMNPYLVISSIMGWSYKRTMANMTANLIDTGSKVQVNCQCGKQRVYSMFTEKVTPVCLSCYGKAVLKKITQ